jgi:hypothetical protein
VEWLWNWEQLENLATFSPSFWHSAAHHHHATHLRHHHGAVHHRTSYGAMEGVVGHYRFFEVVFLRKKNWSKFWEEKVALLWRSFFNVLFSDCKSKYFFAEYFSNNLQSRIKSFVFAFVFLREVL